MKAQGMSRGIFLLESLPRPLSCQLPRHSESAAFLPDAFAGTASANHGH